MRSHQRQRELADLVLVIGLLVSASGLGYVVAVSLY
jgi:hypothetical protein